MAPTHKLPFFNDLTLLIDDIPEYPEFQGTFSEPLDAPLLDLIEKRAYLNDEVRTAVRSLHDAINKRTNTLKSTKYQSYGVGRVYSDNDKSIITMKRTVKHTLFHYLNWSDIDMVKGHASIAIEFARTNNMEPLKGYEDYVRDFPKICRKLIKYYSKSESNPLDEDDIKDLFNPLIYGCAVATWIKKMEEGDKGKLPKPIKNKDDIHPYVSNFIINRDFINKKIYEANPVLATKVASNKETEYEKLCCTVSYWYQAIEHHIVYTVAKYLIDNGIMASKKYAPEYDGLCIPPFLKEVNKADLMNEVNKHVADTTGMNIKFIFKEYKRANIYFDIIKERKKLQLQEPVYDNDELADEIDEYGITDLPTYGEYKTTFEKNHFKIVHPPMFVYVDGANKYHYCSRKNTVDAYEDVAVKCPLKVKGKMIESTSSFIHGWLTDRTIRKYSQMVFSPPPLVPLQGAYNLWEGFDITKEPLVSLPQVEGGRYYAQEWYEYLKVLVGDNKVADYIVARYAYRIQNPAKRSHVCMIICGSEGDGKNMLLKPIYRIFGKYATEVGDAKALYEKHITLEEGKLMVLVNEAGGLANFENADVLKGKITEPTLLVNPKGLPAYETINLCDYDMTTNNMNALKLSEESNRRFFQVESTRAHSSRVDKEEFFTKFSRDVAENPVAIRQIYEWLRNFNVEAVVPSLNFQSDASKPMTAITKEVKLSNRDKILVFFEDVVREPLLNDIEKISNADLFSKWSGWCCRTNVKNHYSTIQFGIKLSQLAKKTLNTPTRVCIVRDPSNGYNKLYVKELRSFFTDLNGVPFKCNDEEEDRE